MFIYKITNIITNKSYIGQTIRTVDKRWKEHCRDKRKTNYFANSIRKYGIECWTVEILETVQDLSMLNEREMYWISYYDTFINGYNNTSGGENGKLFSEETKRKISKSNTGKIPAEESKLKNAESHKGLVMTTENKKKLSKRMQGNKYNTNRILSLETKEKMSLSKIGQKRSEEFKRKISESNKKRKGIKFKKRIINEELSCLSI